MKIQIKIEDNDNLKEAHDLLLKLGFSTYSKESFDVWINQPKPIWLKTNCFDEQPNKIDWVDSGDYKPFKEITLPELRDLVVLKRNDVGDANAFRHDNDVKYYITSDNKYYYFLGIPTFQWTESCNDIDYLEKYVKPIEKKEMKEYLRKNNDGEYILEVTDEREAQEPHAKDWIEIPEGAIKAYLNNSKTINFVNSDDDYMNRATKGEWVSTHRGMHEKCGHVLVWSRHTQPEELPFIDDEPLQSLNDQYAEIGKVRQSAWQKQEGGSHYKNLKIQPMQYALENKLDYAQANVVKYVTRHKEKNGKEDLLKAIHNLELMIEFYYGDEK